MSVRKSASAEMTGNQRRDLIRMSGRDVVIAAGHDVQSRVRDSPFEMPADRHRTDGIGIAPDQERWRRDLLDG